MCGVTVVDAESFWSTWHGRDAYIHDHCLDILLNMHSSINCSGVICSPTVIHAIMREATSETYGPRVSFLLYCISFYLHGISFTILQSLLSNLYNKNTKNIYFTMFIRSHFLRVAVKGMTTRLSRWLQGSWLFVQVLGDLHVISY